MVRGRPHTAYCARAVSSAQTLPARSTELQPQPQPHLRQAQLKPRKSPRTLHTDRARCCSLKRRVFALALRPCRFSCIGESALRPLTVKLRGRTTTSDKRRGRTLSPGARGAKQTTPHGPLQRLLEVALMVLRDVVAAVVTSPRNPEWSPRQS